MSECYIVFCILYNIQYSLQKKRIRNKKTYIPYQSSNVPLKRPGSQAATEMLRNMGEFTKSNSGFVTTCGSAKRIAFYSGLLPRMSERIMFLFTIPTDW